jgi:signal transduction histidine kinase
VIGTILLCVLLNTAFLERYYTDNKKKTLREMYGRIDREIKEVTGNALSDEQKELLDKAELSSNVKIYMFRNIEQVTDFGTMYFTYFAFPQKASISDRERDEMDTKDVNRDIMRVVESYAYYMFPRQNGKIQDVKVLESTDEYSIMSQHDTMLESDFIDIFGELDCGYICLVRVAVESIGEAADIANRFLYITGLFMVCIAIVITSLISRMITKPITELSNIAKRMSNLEFDVKYNVVSCDEIGDLGNSMNSLSSTLEKTISELKSANIKLLSDIERKEEIDRMRTEFISNVTHELKTPIALIQGYAEGLKDCVNDDQENRDFYCDVITDEAVKMNKMVKNLLSLSKIESGGMPLEIERFNINDIVRSVLESTDILFKKNNVRLEFDGSACCCVWADEYMTEEVITNYVSNALNHVDGEKVIRITTEKDGDTVRLSVFNTGERIPEEDIDNIWVKFFKVDKARTREYGGTGIGLSIVKAIMDAHHRPYGVINHEDGVEFWAEFDGSGGAC